MHGVGRNTNAVKLGKDVSIHAVPNNIQRWVNGKAAVPQFVRYIKTNLRTTGTNITGYVFVGEIVGNRAFYQFKIACLVAKHITLCTYVCSLYLVFNTACIGAQVYHKLVLGLTGCIEAPQPVNARVNVLY